MAEPLFRCGFRDCPFSTDNVEELAAHDVATGHPNPTGDPVAPALTRVQQLCANVGGHEPSHRDPTVCGGCGAPILTAQGGQYLCRAAGCDYSTDDRGALAVHDLTTHELQEVRPVVVDKLQRALAQSMCASSGHVPNPRNPSACLICGARLEVFRA